MAGFRSSTLFTKIALILTIVAFVVYLIGFATPYWTSFTSILNRHNGLWQLCIGDNCGSINASNDSTFQAAQAFAVLGFIASLASLVLVILYIFVEQTSTRLVFIITMIASFAAAGLILLAIIIYGSHVNSNLQKLLIII